MNGSIYPSRQSSTQADRSGSTRLTINGGTTPIVKIKFLLATLILLLLPQSLLASGMSLNVGAKASALGGAFRGLADDWSAAWWNPAGLAYLQKSEANSMLSVIVPRQKYEPNLRLSNGSELGYRNDQDRFPDDRIFYYPNFSTFYKFQGAGGFTAGMAFFLPYGLGSKWDLFDPLPGYNDVDTVPYARIDHEASFAVLDFHPSLAKEVVKDKLALGLGLAIQKSDFTWRRPNFIQTTLLPIASMYQQPGNVPRPYDNIIMDSRMEFNGWGVGVNLGVMYQLSPKVKLGGSYRSPVDIKLTGHNRMSVYFPNNSQIVADDRTAEPFFSGKTAQISPEVKTTLKLPAELGAGFAYHPSEKFTLMADIAWTGWSRMKILDLSYSSRQQWISPAGDTLEHGLNPIRSPGDTTFNGTPFYGTPADSAIVFNWKDVTRFSVGAEYHFRERWIARAGYYHDPTAIPDQSLNPLVLDFADKNSLNFGFIYKVNVYEVGYNIEYINYDNREITQIQDVNGDGTFDNFPGNYSAAQYRSFFYFTYRF